MTNITLRQLEYIVAVADTRGFRRAAERCHVSQPSLSTQVQQLEDVLGVKLFERSSRRVLLTQAGEDLIERARRVLTELKDLTDAAARLGDPFAGTLRIGIIPTVAPYTLPELLPAIAAKFPRLRLILREEKTETITQELNAGRLDAGLLALEAPIGELAHETIAIDPFLLAVAPAHPLARRKQVRLADLHEVSVLLLDDGHCFRSQALSLCERAGAHEADFRATSLATLAQMVTSGSGVTLLPELAVATENRRGQLTILPFAAPSPLRTIALVWRPRSPLGDALREIAGVLREAWPACAGAAGKGGAARRRGDKP